MNKTTLALLLAAASAFSWAGDIDSLNLLTQPQFRKFSEDLTGALSYKAIAPAEPLGITGFDIGVEASFTKLESSNNWKTATGSDLSVLPVPKLHAHKGLPFNFDIGAFYTSIPSTNVKLYGGELRYALIEGGIAMPAVAVRGAFSKMAGVDQLDFNTQSMELSISKGFLMFTPYAGAGKVWSKSKPNGSAATVLTQESVSANKFFVGTNINLGLINFALEADKTGNNATYSGKLGLRW